MAITHGRPRVLAAMTLVAGVGTFLRRSLCRRHATQPSDVFAVLGAAPHQVRQASLALHRASSTTAAGMHPVTPSGTSLSLHAPWAVCCLASGLVATGKRVAFSRGTHTVAKAQSDVSHIDFRVGVIVSCEKHPDSDKLLVEQIDIGEEVPRTICSGIAKFFAPEDIVDKKVVIVANLKARKLAGVSSEGMVLCATTKESPEQEEASQLRLVEAPEGAEVGERVVIEVEDEEHGEAAPPNRVGKKKLYEKVAPDLKTNSESTVCFKDSQFTTSAGPCYAKDLPSAIVS